MCSQALQGMRASARYERAIRRMARSRAVSIIVAWLRTARRDARNRRVAMAHRAVSLAGLFRAMFQQWQILGAAAGRRRQAEDAAVLQVGVG